MNNDTAVFSAGSDATSPFIVTLGGVVLANGLTVDEGTVSINGVAANTLGPGATMIVTIAPGLTTTINAKLAGAGGVFITKKGTGTLVITGAANTFQGTLTIQAGTVSVPIFNAGNANGPLPVSTTKIVTFGPSGAVGTLEYTGTTAGTVSVNRRPFVIMSGGTGVFQIDSAVTTLELGGTAPSTITGSVAGQGSLKNTGAGGLRLTNPGNTYGDITVSGGTLAANGIADSGVACAFGQGSTITIDSGAKFSYQSTAASCNRAIVLGAGGGIIDSTTGVLTLTGGITSSPANQPLTITGAGGVTISTTALNIGTGNLTNNGTGILTLSAANTYGATTVNSGVVEGGASGSLGAGNVTVGASGALKLSHASARASGATLALATSPATNTINLNFTGTQTISALYFGTTQKAAGTWGAVGSSATHQSAAFSNTGILNVTAGPASSTALASSADPAVYGALVLTCRSAGWKSMATWRPITPSSNRRPTPASPSSRSP